MNAGNKQKLVNELGNFIFIISEILIIKFIELENDDKKFDTKILTDNTPNNKLNVNGDLRDPTNKKENQCKC